jgi:hypothetical protein
MERKSHSSGRGLLNCGPSNGPLCQICNCLGHLAITCYQRYDESNIGEPSPPIHAYFIAPSGNSNPNWYPDSGATHHLTFDLSNLNISSEDYTGSNQVHMGNGIDLSIHHIDDTLLSSPNASFLLHNMLHVPSIMKNLLFVHRFTLETNTLSFILPIFFVKE